MPELPDNMVTSAADLFLLHREEVLQRLQRRNRSVDFDLLSDAFLEALFELAEAPNRFDSTRGSSVADFLVGAAQRKLLTLLRTDRRRRAREEKVARPVASKPAAARDPAEELVDPERRSQWLERARSVAHNDEERRVLDLWTTTRSGAKIAAQLALPLKEVRRIRDRLLKRLRRLDLNTQDDDAP